MAKFWHDSVPNDGIMRVRIDQDNRMAAGSQKLTATGIVLGTPEFMSPEQVRGKEIDPRSDVYALAIVAFEMFTGQLPFEGRTPGLSRATDSCPSWRGVSGPPLLPRCPDHFRGLPQVSSAPSHTYRSPKSSSRAGASTWSLPSESPIRSSAPFKRLAAGCRQPSSCYRVGCSIQ